jgi:hypothetical protein
VEQDRSGTLFVRVKPMEAAFMVRGIDDQPGELARALRGLLERLGDPNLTLAEAQTLRDRVRDLSSRARTLATGTLSVSQPG